MECNGIWNPMACLLYSDALLIPHITVSMRPELHGGLNLTPEDLLVTPTAAKIMASPPKPGELPQARPAVNASKSEQGTLLKRHLAQGLMKSMAVAPKSHKYVKKLVVGAEDLNEKESTVYQCEARSHEAPKEQNSQEFLLLNQSREPSVLPYTPVTLEQQPRVSLSWEPPGTSARPKRFSSVILQPRATSGPLLLQPQVPNASNQDSVSAALEWQRKLEAAEALLALKNSFQAPPDSVCLQQPGVLPGPAGERGLQTPGPYLPPRPTSSVALPTGHLDCISFLT